MRESLTDKFVRLARRIAEWVDGPGEKVWRAHAALLIPAVIGAALLGLLTWGAAEVYEAVTDRDGVSLLDRPALDLALSLRNPGLDNAVTAFTTVGGPVVTPIVGGIIIVVLALYWRSFLPITLTAAAMLGAIVVTVVGKNYVGRVRPPHELAVPPYEWSPSFPSGHSLNSMVIGGIIAYLLLRRLEKPWARTLTVVVALLYTLLMGLSRVYLGHHWLTDVITGWAMGAAWLALVIAAHLVAVELKRRNTVERAPDTR